MASTQIYSIAFVAVLSMLSQNVGSNPVLSAQETYDSYARLVCTTDKLWRDDDQLYRDFKEDRIPGTTAIPAVDVPNLLLTNEMTASDRFQSTEVDLLANHRDYLYNYKYILDHVIEDERNSTSPNSFDSDMNNILFLLNSAIADLEYTWGEGVEEREGLLVWHEVRELGIRKVRRSMIGQWVEIKQVFIII
ncbi:hypothetical protein BSL78_16227 [Apostichopus japonicus]|uniref:Uncharacterized protein n=1 Tax=Stichopus japonicus TaxID=307972 RepID=A0A2G8KFY2_STIJA|nr:hypothetical protein BSL78_16227 [Apostichopus japonicus]